MTFKSPPILESHVSKIQLSLRTALVDDSLLLSQLALHLVYYNVNKIQEHPTSHHTIEKGYSTGYSCKECRMEKAYSIGV